MATVPITSFYPASTKPALSCANPRCQAANSGELQVCDRCGKPLLRRYLWIVGGDGEDFLLGQVLSDRYWVVGDRIVLDLQPARPPEVPTEITPNLQAYLKLFHHRGAVPQVYGILAKDKPEIWLLEDGPIYPHGAPWQPKARGLRFNPGAVTEPHASQSDSPQSSLQSNPQSSPQSSPQSRFSSVEADEGPCALRSTSNPASHPAAHPELTDPDLTQPLPNLEPLATASTAPDRQFPDRQSHASPRPSFSTAHLSSSDWRINPPAPNALTPNALTPNALDTDSLDTAPLDTAPLDLTSGDTAPGPLESLEPLVSVARLDASHFEWTARADSPRSASAPPTRAGTLMPTLGASWPEASGLRQLNWLWQMAALCGPLRCHGVGTTLLCPELIRVDGSQIRMLELKWDSLGLELRQLGDQWCSLIPTADPAIAPFLSRLCDALLSGELATLEPLVHLLEEALTLAAQSLQIEVHMATRSDRGMQRSANEDACLPQSGTFRITRPGPNSLALVCDGLGGHEGGEVASRIAIETLQHHLQKGSPPQNPPELSAQDLAPRERIEAAIYAVNDRIAEQNNQEQRQFRQRMATTLVLSQHYAPWLYLAHVGDSRVYRATLSGCRQWTVDDDLASHRVCDADSLYRSAVRQGSSGALTQALGMDSSASLVPRIQRLFLDEDTVLLLCSDGLSDHERVEMLWFRTVLRVFTEAQNVAAIADELIHVANCYNGHDNITVALVYHRVAEQRSLTPDDLAPLLNHWPPHNSQGQRPKQKRSLEDLHHSPASKSAHSKQWWKRLLFLPALIGAVAGLGLVSEELGRMVGYGIEPGLPPSHPPALPTTLRSLTPP